MKSGLAVSCRLMLVAGVALLAWGSIAIAADGSAGTPLPFKLELKPYRVSTQASMTFSETGDIAEYRGRLEVILNVINVEARPLVMLRDIRIAQAVTDRGEKLESQLLKQEHKASTWDGLGHLSLTQQFNTYQLMLPFDMPRQSADRLTEIKGELEVVTATAPSKKVTLSPLSDYLGKRITFREMPGQAMVIVRGNPNMAYDQGVVYVEMTRDMPAHVAMLMFSDDRGVISAYEWRSTTRLDTHVRTIKAHIPDHASVHITLHPQVVVRRVPFSVKNIPLVKPESAKPIPADEILLELKPAGQ